MSPIQPYFGMSKILYLQTLFNKLGEFKVAYTYTKQDGTIGWSKHRLMSDAWNDPVFLNKVNNRTCLNGEIRLDIDEGTKEERGIKFHKICDQLDSLKIKYQGYFSGSKGYHIHLISKKLIEMESRFSSYSMKKKIRKIIIDQFKTDFSEVSESSMLTLEWAENNKTRKPKIPIRGDFSWIY